MGSVSVSSCRCCMYVSCVHAVAVLNAELCMTSFLLFHPIPCPHPSSPHLVIAFTLEKTHVSLFLLSHTHIDYHRMSIPLEPLTDRLPPLPINLTLAPTVNSICIFLIVLVNSSCEHILFSLIYAKTIHRFSHVRSYKDY